MSDEARRFRIAPVLTATVLVVLLLWLVGSVAGVLMLLFLGILIAVYLDALASALRRRLHVPGRLGFPAALVATLGAVALLFAILVPPVVTQTRELLKLLPGYLGAWQAAFEAFIARVPGLTDVISPGQHSLVLAIYDQLASTVQNVVPKLFAGVHALIYIFSVAVMAIYLAIQPATYTDIVESLFPPARRPFVRHLLGELGGTLRAYIVAQLLTMSVLGVLTAIGLYILGVPYALTFGVFTGLAAIVPFFGTLVSTTLPALFVLNGPSGGTRALLVLGLGVVIHLIEGNLVAPLLMSERVNLPPVLSILGVLIMGELLGPLGLLIAVPTLAIVMVLVRRILIHGIYEGGISVTPTLHTVTSAATETDTDTDTAPPPG
ncbi:MAG TPA: AI-2E family transporter [Gemmatimonadaceae bacterium]|nr:AI-2E family transporter [Gemmatimonadaceae bacterium]